MSTTEPHAAGDPPIDPSLADNGVDDGNDFAAIEADACAMLVRTIQNRRHRAGPYTAMREGRM